MTYNNVVTGTLRYHISINVILFFQVIISYINYLTFPNKYGINLHVKDNISSIVLK